MHPIETPKARKIETRKIETRRAGRGIARSYLSLKHSPRSPELWCSPAGCGFSRRWNPPGGTWLTEDPGSNLFSASHMHRMSNSHLMLPQSQGHAGLLSQPRQTEISVTGTPKKLCSIYFSQVSCYGSEKSEYFTSCLGRDLISSYAIPRSSFYLLESRLL